MELSDIKMLLQLTFAFADDMNVILRPDTGL